MSIPRASNWKMEIVTELRGVGGGAPWKNIELLNRQASAIPPMPRHSGPEKVWALGREMGWELQGKSWRTQKARSARAWGRGMKPRDTACAWPETTQQQARVRWARLGQALVSNIRMPGHQTSLGSLAPFHKWRKTEALRLQNWRL